MYLTGENLGYAKGNNLGLSKVKTKLCINFKSRC